MTEADFNNQIAGKQQEIAGYQQAINDLTDKIGKLDVANQKVTNLNSTLQSFASTSSNKIIFSAGKTAKFFNPLLEAVKGAKYRSTVNNLETALGEIIHKKQEFQEKIEEYQRKIASCNAQISSLSAQKASFLAAEAQRAAQAQTQA